MREKYLNYLHDPVSGNSLNIKVLAKFENQITAGLLQNETDWYPIIKGIPRMLVGNLKKDLLQRHYDFYNQWRDQLPGHMEREWREALTAIKDFDRFVKHQVKTGASFAFEWKNIYRENKVEKENFLHFIGPYTTEETIRGKTVIDVGCGSGRFTKQALDCGAKTAIGMDVGDSVEVAYEMTKKYDNACIVQADIFHLPFLKIFDLIYSLGVIHHLPQPQSGFEGFKKMLKPGGLIVIWVYNRRHNKRAIYLYEPIRAIIKRLPKPFVYRLSYIPAALVQGLNYFANLLNKLGLKNLAKKMPFSYYAKFPFNMKLNDSFDVLATPKSNYYLVEEIETWFRQAGLQSIQSSEHPEAGITCQGVG